MTDPTAAPSSSPRDKIIDALMDLAGERAFDDISIGDIVLRAGVSLADFREAFPSKGAALAGFNRRVDRAVLSAKSDALEGEPAKERLFDVLMRRLDAMAPWRAGVRGVAAWARRDPLSAAALNREALNSMRFMLEAAGIGSEGSLGALKLQGLVVAFGRVLAVWFDDEDPGFSETMAALDRELTRGETIVRRVEDIHRVTSPLRAMAQSFMAAPFSRAPRRRPRADPLDEPGMTEV